jgi:hypothetical protein
MAASFGAAGVNGTPNGDGETSVRGGRTLGAGGGTGYFFLLAAALALVACWSVMTCCFFLLAPSFLTRFWEACFWLAFGERSPMGFLWLR